MQVEAVVALLRDFAKRLARENGVTEDGVRRQLRLVNGVAVQILAAAREQLPEVTKKFR